jgi:hypothetical protein
VSTTDELHKGAAPTPAAESRPRERHRVSASFLQQRTENIPEDRSKIAKQMLPSSGLIW